MRTRGRWAAAAAALAVASTLAMAPPSARADDDDSRFSAAGYLRIMTRPDFQGGDSKLGFSNLYGRLLNEGPYASLEMRLSLVPRRLTAGGGDSGEVWTLVSARVEGGSVGRADAAGGSLDNFRLSQLYVQAGNVLAQGVTWQLGTLNTFQGDLGLFDFRLAELLGDTIGLSGRYQRGRLDIVVGGGDAGFTVRGERYSTLLTAGATARVAVTDHIQVGIGGQGYYEPEVEGNPNAPHNTPGVDYEDFVRGEVAERFLEDNPGMAEFFPKPVPTSASSWKAVGYLGFGGVGPLTWSSTYANVLRRHPGNVTTETTTADGDFDIYIESLTDEQFEFNIGNETLLSLIPRRLDAVIAMFYARHWDRDNAIKPTERDRTLFSTVARLQYYVTPTLHLLGETSWAHETSANGNLWRNNADSVFQSTAGISDSRGLEFGDADTRRTFQGKVGVVINPQRFGIYTRPSIRVLYGVQHSTQNNAFGNNFVDSLDEFDDFMAQESHLHHVIALEAEAWF